MRNGWTTDAECPKMPSAWILKWKNLPILINGDPATVEFDQYYRSKNYSDWGPKILQVKQTAHSAKIFYEVLKESYPL